MKKKKIPTWQDRCEVHPDHQMGMITYQMIQDRMQEEIDELREFIEQQEKEISILREDLVTYQMMWDRML